MPQHVLKGTVEDLSVDPPIVGEIDLIKLNRALSGKNIEKTRAVLDAYILNLTSIAPPKAFPLTVSISTSTFAPLKIDVLPSDLTWYSNPVTQLERNYNELARDQFWIHKVSSDISLTGSILSFHLSDTKKSFLSTMFSLPESAIEVGESWDVPYTHLIELSNGVTVKEAERFNKGILLSYGANTGEEIFAEIVYVIQERISGFYSLRPHDSRVAKSAFEIIGTYIAYGKFLVEKGCWDYYVGQEHFSGRGYLDHIDSRKLRYFVRQVMR
ncbi:hypothetical protein OLMES_0213 [Oleiphilus messinensis]|uniref:Uncharacterized protein n=2 Tax=Oleiphilus messinensis TaxID=141451 RepID=A0A1Y0I236_9GAMM|nr:hypothetical protein OLMES_0213 [Oleiphilus messinensis]